MTSKLQAIKETVEKLERESSPRHPNNSEWIAFARTALPDLLHLAEELEAKVDAAEDRRVEMLLHETLMASLLDDLKAPTHPGNDPSRPPFGSYGRLKAYAESIGIKASIWEATPADRATAALAEIRREG